MSHGEKEAFTVVSFYFFSCYLWHFHGDQSKDILNSILKEDVLSDSDSEEPIEES